jgi:aminopeptidase N
MLSNRWLSLVLAGCTIVAGASGQHLPKGAFHPNRERTYDILHFKADIAVDWTRKDVHGESTILLKPLSACSLLVLDVYRLSVTAVALQPNGKPLGFSLDDSTLSIRLDRVYQPSDTMSITVHHSAVPTAGFYFVDPQPGRSASPSAYTYGEGGLHANWLPVYADVNDKFSSEMVVTVPEPLVVISNGSLINLTEHQDGTRTFHWLQQLPHANYLMAVYIGDYDSVRLASAFDTLPITCWVPRGRKAEGRLAFRSTPKMVEFFSRRFQYRYPWEKYDQVVVLDYAIGAMENTTVTGLNDYVLRISEIPDEANPVFDSFTSVWSRDELIAHELAHHWFGDNITCRSLGSIWLNEGFATYAHMLWDEESGGEEFLQFKVWRALQAYLDYVRQDHVIRPMEWRRYDTVDEMYNEEHTYLKGAMVLHMLRWILGDEAFFSSLGYYLRKHQFSSVESSDFKISIEEACGKNLQWFFDQWIYSGGHPRLEVRYRYHADRKIVDLTIDQTQPLVEGQGLFTLPVEIRIDTKTGMLRDTVLVAKETEHFTFPVADKPEMVSIDGRGKLVCELIWEKELPELLYQLEHDALPGRLWALHQLVSGYNADPRALGAIRVLLEGGAAWWLKAEAISQLRNVHTPDAVNLLLAQLSADDYHQRKAAAIALGFQYTPGARQALRQLVRSETESDVVAAAIVALARTDSLVTAEFLGEQMNRASWYDELRSASLVAMRTIGAKRFLPLIRSCCAPHYTMRVREEALNAWAACAPEDPQLHRLLAASAEREVLRLREKAVRLLSELKVEGAIPVLERLARTDGHSDIRALARDAVAEIQRVSRGQ